MISSVSANPLGAYHKPVDKPKAPASMASATCSFIIPSSPPVGWRLSIPITAVLTVPWPTRGTRFIEVFSDPSFSRYSPNVPQSKSMPYSAAMGPCLSFRKSDIGAMEPPQFPITSVVTPW